MQKPRVGKYARLAGYLLNSGIDRITMTFCDIEEVIGAKLPPSE